VNIAAASTSRAYVWTVFTLTFALMLSDFAARTIIGPIFPLLKAEWGLSDTQLGSLVSVIALIVGLLSLPVSMVADRCGRARSVSVMATMWGLATMACGLSVGFVTLLLARATGC
jgi:predicted MFS family arabinose efflux permease